MENSSEKAGLILMTYGSATTAEQVRSYLTHIYGDKVSEARIMDFEDRYRRIGHSPLIEITTQQAELVEAALGKDWVVRAGMRHLDPSITEAVEACRKAGATKIVGIILSPQYSSFIMGAYQEAFLHAATDAGFSKNAIVLAPAWPTEKDFIALLVQNIQKVLKRIPTLLPIIFTTHSLPQRVVAEDPNYLKQLQATITAVRAHLTPEQPCYAAYQSAGHTPEAWLTPDLTEVLSECRTRGEKAVFIVPIQFLADHLEVLYDLDIATKEQCEARGLAYYRTDLPNTDALFISALAAIATAASQSLK